MPEELAQQIPLLYKLFEKLKITLIKQSGVEADDIIGSITQQYFNEELEFYIVSGDKDLHNSSIKMYSYTLLKRRELSSHR